VCDCCNCDVGQPDLTYLFCCERQFLAGHWFRRISGSHYKGFPLSKIDFDKGIPLFTNKAIPLPIRLALKRGAGNLGKIG
jgi:hypothetical protein